MILAVHDPRINEFERSIAHYKTLWYGEKNCTCMNSKDKHRIIIMMMMMVDHGYDNDVEVY